MDIVHILSTIWSFLNHPIIPGIHTAIFGLDDIVSGLLLGAGGTAIGDLLGLGKSDRQEKGEKLYGEQLQGYDDLIKAIMDSKSEFGDVSSLNDVSRRFGIKPFDVGGYKREVSSAFSKPKRSLATALNRNRSAISARSGASATPEFAFQPAEANYSSALSDLEGKEGEANLSAFDKAQNSQFLTADFLKSILGAKDIFGQNKLGQRQSALGSKSNAIANYLGTQSPSSGIEDLFTGASIGADIGNLIRKGKGGT